MERRNVLGTQLQICSSQPITGYNRDGYCQTRADDTGTHVVCAEMTDDFLQFTRSQNNDLTTPNPSNNFPGLEAGQRWCLCALRWKEALNANKAPPVILGATHRHALDFMPLDLYKAHSRTNG